MTNTKKPIILIGFVAIFFSFFITLLSHAQKQTYGGYYISNTGDSIGGSFLNYTQWGNKLPAIKFAPSQLPATIELTTLNTKKFVVAGYDTYLRYTGSRMLNPIEFDEALKYKEDFLFSDTSAAVSTFVRLVAKSGNCEIYVLSDKVRTNFYYRLDTMELTELKFKMYYDNGKVNEVYEYRQQLNALFAAEIKKKGVERALERVEYTEQSLTRFFDKLTPGATVKKKVKNVASGLVVAGGISMNSFRVTGDENIYETKMNFKTSFSPVISIGYLSAVDRNFNKYFIYPQLKLYTYNSKGEIADAEIKAVTTYKTSLMLSPVVNLGINFINTKAKKVFASVGGGMIFFKNNTEFRERTLVNNTGVVSSSALKFSGLSYDVNVSAGLTINKKIIVAGTFNLPTPVKAFFIYTLFHSSIQLTVGYKFK